MVFLSRLTHRLCREISFQFRTRLPHGLLVYHNVKNPSGIDLDPYALYVIVEKGQLKVVHVFGKHSTSVTVGEGLNRDEWHSVMVSRKFNINLYFCWDISVLSERKLNIVDII
jgi:Laminin G domain